MAYAYRDENGDWQEIFGSFATADFSYPPGWVEAATPQMRWDAGVSLIVDGKVEPWPHEVKTGEYIADAGGVPTRTGTFAETTIEARSAALLTAIRDKRWTREQAGFTSSSGPVRTDDTAQSKVSAAAQLLALDETITGLDWEIAPGNWATITRAQLFDLSLAIGQHVQACFTRSRQLTEAVQAATSHAELDAIDLTSGWPA